MKTAIYIDQELFDEAEGFSYVAEMSRSKLYCTALSEYIQNHKQDYITKQLNDYYDKHESKPDNDVKFAAHRVLERAEW